MSILLTHVTANLISRLSLLPLDGLQLLLVVGAHVAASTELPASVLHLGADTKKMTLQGICQTGILCLIVVTV